VIRHPGALQWAGFASLRLRMVCKVVGRHLRAVRKAWWFAFDTPNESGSFSLLRFDSHTTFTATKQNM
jgi:hypothetical protein